MGKKVSIVILNYKNRQDTLECLRTVLGISYSSCRVIVVDNDSQNDSLVHIGKWLTEQDRDFLPLTQEQSENADFVDHPLVLIQSASNRGYAAGNNIGIRWAVRAGDEYVLILNNDTLVEKGFLEPLADFLDTDPASAMAGPKILDPDGDIDHNCARRRTTLVGFFFRFGIIKILCPRNKWVREHYYTGEYDFKNPREVDVLAGSCMLIRLEVLKQIDFLDEATFLFLEEFILCEKMRSLQKKAFIVPASVITHEKGSSVKSSPSPFVLKKEIDSFYYYLTEYRHVPFFLAHIILSHKYLRYCFCKIKLPAGKKDKRRKVVSKRVL